MPRTTNMRLRALWFQVHKWTGLTLALLIIPLSLSGAALVWHDGLDRALNPDRYAVSGERAFPPSSFASIGQAALGPGERLASLRFPLDGGPVVVGAVRAGPGGRPARITIWLDPATGRLLDKASADAGLMRFVHNLHGSFAFPGSGRTAVGLVGLFMFCSCLTGLWLWWPVTGSFRRGFRWKRQNSTNANLHHLLGFWVLLPLAMLSFTGAWISFPAVVGGGAGPDRARLARALPLEHPRLHPDSAVAATMHVTGGTITAITWPTDRSPEWRLTFEGTYGRWEAAVNDRSGAAAARPPAGGPTLIRRLHDGTGMGLVWQILIFLAGLIPAALAVTGIVMWLRSRGWRAALAAKRKQAI